MPPKYDLVSKVERTYIEAHEKFEVDSDTSESGREMDVLRSSGAAASSSVPSQQAISSTATALDTQVQTASTQIQQTAAAQHQVASFESGATVTNPNSVYGPGPITGDEPAKRKCRLSCCCCIGVSIGVGVPVGATLVILWIAGAFDAAESGNVTAPDPAKPNTPTPTTGMTPSEATLQMWVDMDDGQIFKRIRDLATKKGDEWGLARFSYVMEALGKLLDTLYDRPNNPEYQSLIAPQSEVDADYAAWRTSNQTLIDVYDASAKVTDPARFPNDPGADRHLGAFGRGVRIDYLRRFFDKAVLDDMAAGKT